MGIRGHPIREVMDVNSAVYCQYLCQMVDRCSHFTYNIANEICFLHDNKRITRLYIQVKL